MVGDGKNLILLLYPRKLSNVLKLLTFSRYTPFLMVQIAIRITRGSAGLVIVSGRLSASTVSLFSTFVSIFENFKIVHQILEF